ncbi:MAG: 2-C-methyl-D-erythritol 2,4-cyclodiphosphate synthase [Bacteroidales bacterium]|nr:2-C-methyl-D-erythritol 2,4-cyclodiphosphate synthase [Bacteroidales bacterium]MDD3891406.1 2-C-methyl-D-erythritol 2,4-cyclodiphosphate synthase [Bacteroidales bacterium]
MSIRVGIGYDVHQLAKGHKFWLGGIEINHTKGSVGHSDGDVLIHAICDAMLGAVAMRDIGFHFPDTDPNLKGVDSKVLLKRVQLLISDKGYGIGNIDSTICLQNPKLKNIIPEMQRTLEQILGLPGGTVSVKASTTESLGFVGREEGVSAYAVVMLIKETKHE